MLPDMKVARLGVQYYYQVVYFRAFGLRCSLAGNVMSSFFESRSKVNHVFVIAILGGSGP